MVAARDVNIGDTVLSVDFVEFGDASQTPDYAVYTWNSDTLTYEGQTSTVIQQKWLTVKNDLVWFNGDSAAKWSTEEPVLVKRNDVYEFYPTGSIVEGDIIFKYDGNSVTEVTVTSIETEAVESVDTYNFYAQPYDLLVAEQYLVHNK